MKKMLFTAVLVLAMTASAAFAEVLGTVSGEVYNDMGAYSVFHRVQFDGGNAGRQTENYVEYKPNAEATPVIVNGASLWGTQNLLEAKDYLAAQGIRSVAGINADYFSFKTGLQMGYGISGGRLISKDFGPQPAIGFREDGTSFIDNLEVETTAIKGESAVRIMYINKWCQRGFDPIYMLTREFGDSTRTEGNCIFVLCSVVDGDMKIGTDMTLAVEDSFIYEGAIQIPENQIVLLMDTSGDADCYAFLSSLAKGDEFVIRNEAINSEKNQWATAVEATSTTGARLIKDGQICSGFEEGAAPRTAVGVKENGNLIMYTLDGRQSGYSYGCRLETLARRMAELGCVDAINLDGGGSTTIGALLGGEDNFELKNSPSDGSMRNVSNFIFLRDNRTPTGVPWIVNAALDAEDYLRGATAVVSVVSMYDTANYKMESQDINASCDIGEGNGNTVTFTTGGVANITVTAGDTASTVLNCNVYDSPQEVRVYLKDNMSAVSEIYAEPNEQLELDLCAAAFVEGRQLKLGEDSIVWRTSGNIGTISSNGHFVLRDTEQGSGKIAVSIGDTVKEIPVVIGGEMNFKDLDGHWAKDIVEAMAAEGIIYGVTGDDGRRFYPDNDMTRAEYAVIMTRFLGVNGNEYADDPAVFADEEQIPDWARNCVKAMYARGIINGKSAEDGVVFDAMSPITRAEAMTIIGRLTDEDAPEAGFADSAQIPDWAREGINKLAAKGVINGYEDNTIHPLSNVKRAEAASMLYKFRSVQ
ncbi:MAG: phosphodiester glycosidase family protein [Clostridiales bacterium]|nr:phosphodiester glycosidase family protein [Clostridiales bacterium]